MNSMQIPLLAAALFCTIPGHAQAAASGDLAGQRSQTAAEPSPSEIDAQLKAYGEWLMQLQAIVTPVLGGLAEFGPEWQRIDLSNGEAVSAFRSRVGQFTSVVDEADRALEAMPAPEFPYLGLPDDLRPAAIKRDQLTLNAGVKNLLADLQTLLAADGLSAVERAAQQVFKGVQLMLQHQIRFARAMLATTDKEASSWDFGHAQLILFRSMSRLVAAVIGVSSQLTVEDPRLAPDLLALADQLAVHRTGGERKLDAELREFRLAAADLTEQGDADRLRLLRRSQAVLELGREYVPLTRDLEQTLRTAASRVAEQPIRLQTLVDQLVPLGQVKMRIERIAFAESAALAGP